MQRLRSWLASLGLCPKPDAAPKPSHSRAIIESAGDAILSTDEHHTIVLANPAAAAMFGSTVEAMQGSPLGRFIPRALQAGDQPNLRQFGQTGVSLRTSGRRSSDYAVTGQKADGEKFALEGSIASLMEDDKLSYTIVLRDITARKQIEEKLVQSHAQLRELSAALQTIREEERTHIARELHDDLGQLLATLRGDLSLLRNKPALDAAAQRALDGMDQVLLAAIISMRRIAAHLRPRALDEGGLWFALKGLREEFIERHAIACELIGDEADLTLDDDTSTAIFRIVQEGLTNVARHAQAGKVLIALQKVDHELHLALQDDGRGIADADLDKAASFGLIGIRERVHALGGALHVDGAAGTRIDIWLPLPDRAAATSSPPSAA